MCWHVAIELSNAWTVRNSWTHRCTFSELDNMIDDVTALLSNNTARPASEPSTTTTDSRRCCTLWISMSTISTTDRSIIRQINDFEHHIDIVHHYIIFDVMMWGKQHIIDIPLHSTAQHNAMQSLSIPSFSCSDIQKVEILN